MLNLNKEQLVEQALNASVDHPRIKGYRGGYDGRARITVGTGGITYSHSIGDDVMNIAGDHVEPGVSMANPHDGENGAVMALACIGNEVKVLNGPAQGAKGFVTGKHGGVDHTMAWFAPEDLEKMEGGENFLIRSCGQGLKSSDTPEVFYMNIDPVLVDAMDLKTDKEGNLLFPVTAVIPAFLMGSGVGASSLMNGDYDIMTQDHEANIRFGLDQLRFGDFVAILDHDAEYGAHYKDGAVTVGVIVHSDSFTSGHGPGVTVVATSKAGKIKPFISRDANLISYLDDLRR